LYETSHALTSTLEPRQVLANTMELATNILNAQASTLMLIDEDTDELVFDIPYGEKRELLRSYRMSKSEGIAGWVATHGEPVIVNEAPSDNRFSGDADVRTGFLTRSAICVPLVIKDRTIGVLEVLNKKSSEGFDEEDLGLLSTMAAQASVAIENARLYRNLQEERDRIISIQEEVRRELARDLHDTTLQRLAAISMGVGHVKQLLRHEPAEAGAELDRLEEVVRQASREARVLLFELRPIILETQGLAPALESYVDQLQGDGPPWFHFDDGGYDHRLASDVELAAFLIIREAVNNARRHSAAENIRLQLKPAEERLSVVVEDDGCGFDLETIRNDNEGRTHLGLVSMRERADLIHAQLDIGSVPGQGTRVVLTLPDRPPLSKDNA
jgi:signal transduction histidine kinase